MPAVIQCNGLTKKYKKKHALNALSFTAEENKIIGLIGRNGAGKTTFLKTCAGYLRPTAGTITLWGEQVFDNLNVISKLIFIDEEIRYNAAQRLKDILELGSIYYATWDQVFAIKLIKHFGLNENLKYKKLSRGMKTQFNMIMGLASRSPLTLLDEPTLGMDAAVRKEFYNILLKDYMENPRTFIISSHLLNEIENLLEEIILIKDGSLVFHKPTEELQDYGVYLNGKKEILEPFLEKKQVLNTEIFGNSLIVGIKNDLTDKEQAYLLNQGVDISKMRVEDVCIFLTKKEKEGEFHVFE